MLPDHLMKAEAEGCLGDLLPGWRIERVGGQLLIQHVDIGGVPVHAEDVNPMARLLHRLLSDLLRGQSLLDTRGVQTAGKPCR